MICDNLQEPDRIEAVVAPLSAAGIRAGVVSRESIDRDASSGRLTDYYVPVEQRGASPMGGPNCIGDSTRKPHGIPATSCGSSTTICD